MIESRLPVVCWCDLSPITVPVPPALLDSARFPAAKQGFESYAMATEAHYPRAKCGLVDISGLTKDEVENRLFRDYSAQLRTERIRLPQVLQYLEGEQGFKAHPKLSITRLVAYHHPDDQVVVAEPLPRGGWKRVRSLPVARWGKGTVGLFQIEMP